MSKLIELVFYVKIIASPLILSVICAALIYGWLQNTIGIVLGSGTIILGIIVGVLWANKIKRKGNPSDFEGLTRRNPELDSDTTVDKFK